MILEHVQDRLKDAAQPPLKHVAGAASFAALTSNPPRHLMPAAYTIPLTDIAGANTAATGVVQRVAERVGVLLALGDLSDRRGDAAALTVETVRETLRGVLVGWQPSAEHTAMTLTRGRINAFTDGVIWWLDEFEALTWVRA